MPDFDRVIERRGTHASKWDMMTKLSGIPVADGIPMWVADMDFAAPDGVTEALKAVVDRGVAATVSSTTLAKDVVAFPFDQKGLMGGISIQGSKITTYNPNA